MKDSVESRLRKQIVREMRQCTGKDGSNLSDARTTLKKKYLGYGYSNDDDRSEQGLSTYVDRTVMETVEWAKPGLMRVFCGDEIIRFDPRTREQEQAAADATEYVNQVVFGRNIFRIVHDVLTDGLMQRVGWCIAHAPEREVRTMERFEGLTEDEAMAALVTSGVDLDDEGSVEIERYAAPFTIQVPAPMPPQAPVPPMGANNAQPSQEVTA